MKRLEEITAGEMTAEEIRVGEMAVDKMTR